MENNVPPAHYAQPIPLLSRLIAATQRGSRSKGSIPWISLSPLKARWWQFTTPLLPGRVAIPHECSSNLLGTSQVKNSSEIVFSPRIWHWAPTQLSADLQYIRANQSIQVPWVYGCAARQVVQGGSLWQEKLCCHRGKGKLWMTLVLCIALPWRIDIFKNWKQPIPFYRRETNTQRS